MKRFISRLIYKYWYRNIYLKSPAWEITRRIHLKKKCERCGEKWGLQLHHVVYRLNYRPHWSHWLSKEAIYLPDHNSTFLTLCNDCHRKEHQ